MIEEQARVMRVAGERVEIAVARQPACNSCSAKGGCGTSLLSSIFPQRQLRFWLRNGIGAEAGDQVIVGLDERRLQRGSLLLYALPLFGLLLGAVFGEAGSPLVGMPAELGAVLVGLLGLIVALAFVRRVAAKGVAEGNEGVRLLRVAHRSPSIAAGDLAVMRAHRVEGLRKFQ